MPSLSSGDLAPVRVSGSKSPKNLKDLPLVPQSARSTGSRRGSKKVYAPESDARFDAARAPTPALGKLGIGTSIGTLAKKELLFGKKKLKEIRTLRDQMMTIAGGMTAFANMDDRSQAHLFDANAMMKLTAEMSQETMDRNMNDDTWELLKTPGYLEQVGKKAFMSDTQRGFQADHRYAKALTTVDKSKGIKRDELRVWSEDAIKSGKIIFSSGGSMKI